MSNENEEIQQDEEIEQNSPPEDSLEQEAPAQEEIKQEQPDPYLEEAIKYGYKPDYQGPNKKSPKEFVEFGREYDERKKLREEVARLAEQLEAQRKQDAEAAVKRARAELERHLQTARESGNLDAVEQLAQRKAEMEYQNSQQQLAQKAKEEAEVNAKFLERNSYWYNDSNPQYQEEARLLGVKVFQDFPNISYQEAALRVETAMKWNHPEIAIAPKSSPTPNISNNRSTINKSAMDSNPTSEGVTLKSLSALDQAEYKTLKAHIPDYTVQDFLKAKSKYTE